MTTTAYDTPKRVKTSLAPVLIRAGVPLDKVQTDLIERIAKADALARSTDAEAKRLANDDHVKRTREAILTAVEKAVANGGVLEAVTPVPAPDVETARLTADVARAYATTLHSEFTRTIDPDVIFSQIEERWSSEVDWRSNVNADKLTLSEAEKLEAEAEETRSALLNLSLSLADFEKDDDRERKAHRAAQRKAGRPVSLSSLRAEWSRKNSKSKADE